MSRKLIAVTLSFIITLGTFGGCAAILSRDYLVITPHLEQHVDKESDDELRVETYQGLKNAILHLIENSIEEGLILYYYSGDAQEDVRDACMTTTNNDPLGVYAVEYMSFECVRILTYYEVTISITYRRTPEQINSIVQIQNSTDFRDRFRSACLDYESSFTADIQYYNENQYNVTEMLEDTFYANPLRMLAVPTMTVNIYPDTGWRRIVEVLLTNSTSPEELEDMSSELISKTFELLSEISTQSDIDKIQSLDSILTKNVDFISYQEVNLNGTIERDSTFTAYGALIDGNATASGYALAFKAMCDLSGISCHVVRGRYGSLSHWWNIVDTGNGWYHVDTSLNDSESTNLFLLKTDTEMSETHKWNPSSYPLSGSDPMVLTTEGTSEVLGLEDN